MAALSLAQCEAVEPWAFGPVVNVIGEVKILSKPVSHKGALSIWSIDDAVLEDVRSQLARASSRLNVIEHLPPAWEGLPPPQPKKREASSNNARSVKRFRFS